MSLITLNERKGKMTNENKRKDAVSKKYMEDADRFCELINYGLFAGKQVLKPENLTTMSVEEFTRVLKITAKARDVLNQCAIKSDGSTQYIMLGLENTSYIDYRAPLKHRFTIF